MVRNVAIALLAVMTTSVFAQPMPLDLAFSRRQIPGGERHALSGSGRWLAYEVRTPLVKSPDAAGEVEPRFLPNGMPAYLTGIRLFVVDTRGGESKPLCGEPSSCWRPSWSPDDRQLAYYSDAGGEIGVWLYDVTTQKSHRLGTTRIKAKLWPNDIARWSPNGKTLYVPTPPPRQQQQTMTKPRNAQAGVTVYRTRAAAAEGGADGSGGVEAINQHALRENDGEITAIDLAGAAARVVVANDQHPNVMRLSPDGKWIAFLNVFRITSAEETDAKEDLFIVPAAGGKAVAALHDIVLGGDDYAGRNFRWTADSRHVAVIRNHDLWILDAATSAPPRQLAPSIKRITLPLLLANDGKSVIAGIERDEKTFDFASPGAIAVVPLDGSAPRVLNVAGTPIAAGEDAVLQRTPASIDVIRDSSLAEREVVRVDLGSGKTARVWSGRARLEVAGATGDGIIARYETVNTPPDFYLFDRDFGKVRRLTTVEPRFEAVKVGNVESFTTSVPRYDGRFADVSTHVFLPPGAKAGDALPTLVFFYSGLPFTLYARDFGGGAPSSIPVQIFASRGYAVLFCDVPLGPEGKPGNPVQEMTDVVLAQVYRAAALGYADLKRVAIMGHSYGGYSAAAIITHTQLFRAALALDGLYDLASSYAWMDPGGTNDFMWAESGQGRMGAHPWADLQRYIDNSPFYQAGKIHTPLLLIHGEKDGACPVAEARKMFSAMKRLGRECELATYAGEGHVTGRWALANAVDAAQRMVEFLDAHVKK